jgi:shikimate kinase
MSKPYVITFAGVPGSSKSIIAYYLSIAFSLPIFSTDNIRYEVREDLLVSDINNPKALKEFQHRQSERYREILARKQSFIRDGSVDRHWQEIKEQLDSAGYNYCLIDMELSRDFMTNLYSKTNRPKSIEELDAYLVQHTDFMKKYSKDVTLEITDKLFKDRTSLSETAVRKFIES